jgi:hypothetical protein
LQGAIMGLLWGYCGIPNFATIAIVCVRLCE